VEIDMLKIEHFTQHLSALSKRDVELEDAIKATPDEARACRLRAEQDRLAHQRDLAARAMCAVIPTNPREGLALAAVAWGFLDSVVNSVQVVDGVSFEHSAAVSERCNEELVPVVDALEQLIAWLEAEAGTTAHAMGLTHYAVEPLDTPMAQIADAAA
jgi:choline dehydrogenase-like flavoprotein